ncbi:uncharacterized protein BP5553_07926 [Venustampulla echinocandica]|uniref:Uncharacterized protein n=1 Tax=Venustampulla echinocandica TaxID=2656787 RepID=A0A370THY0_9HELO|nr:uncharacterized protein BP5553_07926 [Venustampulla echinocandica]RDL34798.1 hypothetical protein BP5553_07926 [Venustampulla echinocandica]
MKSILLIERRSSAPIKLCKLTGATYYENWGDHPPTRAFRRGEPTPPGPSLMDMIRPGELEENEATLEMAREELRERSLEASQEDPSNTESETSHGGPINERDVETMQNDSIPWISSRDEEQIVDHPSNDKRDTSTAASSDSFPWVSERDEEETDSS